MIPYRMNPFGRDSGAKVFTLTVKPGIFSSALNYGFTPYWNTGGYCNVLNWGDGVSESAGKSGTTMTHTYAKAGVYCISIQANCYNVYFAATNPALVYDSNGEWDALGTITDGYFMFYTCFNAIFAFKKLPDTLWRGQYMFGNCFEMVLTLTALPVSLTNGTAMFQNCSRANMYLTRLPEGIATMYAMFDGCSKLKIDIGEIAQNAPSRGLTSLSNLTYAFRNCPLVTGSRSAFLAKCPNVGTNTTEAFKGTATTD